MSVQTRVNSFNHTLQVTRRVKTHRQHGIGARSWVGSNGAGDVVKGVFDVVLVVKNLSVPVRLNEQVTRRQEPRQGKQIGRQRFEEDVEGNGGTSSFWREKLIGRVVLLHIRSKNEI